MHIQIYMPNGKPQPWLNGFAWTLPKVRLSVWGQDAVQNVDYAMVWQPLTDIPHSYRDLRAVFNLGAGVDVILGLHAQASDAIPGGLPIVRLDDVGTAAQTGEYVTHAVLRFFRRLDEYERQRQVKMWRFLKSFNRDEFVVGVLSLGMLGTYITRTLAGLGFPVCGWGRSARRIEGVGCRSGSDALPGFLTGTRVLVSVLPLTAGTENVIDMKLPTQLAPGTFVVNVARGRHIVEDDLLVVVYSDHIVGTALDIFRIESLLADHLFWTEPRIHIMPHTPALMLHEVSTTQTARKIRALEAGESIAGIVDLQRGY